MTPKALRALRGSIRKWQKIVDGTGVDHGADNCPLCAEFYDKNPSCMGCPVRARTGKANCCSTPFQTEWMAHGRTAVTDADIVAAVKELRFLKSLLPPPKRRTARSRK